ncbi:MAG: hypothetical protein LBO72_08860 [Helicobacteraceae bacterium]|jgi:hypothetical protein|nr:hypothetical protein [Helicobacteraceae bacterium]
MQSLTSPVNSGNGFSNVLKRLFQTRVETSASLKRESTLSLSAFCSKLTKLATIAIASLFLVGCGSSGGGGGGSSGGGGGGSSNFHHVSIYDGYLDRIAVIDVNKSNNTLDLSEVKSNLTVTTLFRQSESIELGTSLTVTGDINLYVAPDVKEIDDQEGLHAIQFLPNGRHILIKDIQLKPSDIANLGFDANEGWEPIGTNAVPFTGVFNGNGHKITGLWINRPSGDASHDNYVGLFGKVVTKDVNVNGALIKNVGVEVASGKEVVGHQYVGAIAGYIEGTIKNSYVKGDVRGTYDSVGAIAGTLESGSILESYATGNIDGRYYVGGIAGNLINTYAQSIVKDSYAKGRVSGQNYIGGVVGGASGNSDIIESNSSSVVSGQYQIGGIVGYSQSSISGSHATTDVSGSNNFIGGIAGQIENGDITGSYATGKVTGDNQVGGIVGDISYGLITNSQSAGDVNGTDYIGGIAGKARNHSLIDGARRTAGDVNGTDYIGGIAGEVSESSDINGSSTRGYIRGDDKVGGVAGAVDATSSIANSYYEKPADSTNAIGVSGDSEIGGLAGDANGTIINSYATGSVGGTYQVGGLAGRLGGDINNSYATGNVFGDATSSNIGGIAGGLYESSSSITNSYAIGNVKGGSNVGGIAGIISAGQIKYNAAINQGLQGDGGGNGLNYVTGNGSANVSDNFHLQGTTLVGTTNGGDSGVAKTETDFKTRSTYENALSGVTPTGLAWDFALDFADYDNADSPWKITTGINNGFPYLYWEKR